MVFRRNCVTSFGSLADYQRFGLESRAFVILGTCFRPSGTLDLAGSFLHARHAYLNDAAELKRSTAFGKKPNSLLDLDMLLKVFAVYKFTGIIREGKAIGNIPEDIGSGLRLACNDSARRPTPISIRSGFRYSDLISVSSRYC